MTAALIRVLLVSAIVLGLLAAASAPDPDSPTSPTFGRFLTDLEARQVRAATVHTRHNSVHVVTTSGRVYEVGHPDEYGTELVRRLRDSEVGFHVKKGGAGPVQALLPSGSAASGGHGRRLGARRDRRRVDARSAVPLPRQERKDALDELGHARVGEPRHDAS